MHMKDSIQDILAFYQKNGWVVVDGVFAHDCVDRVLKVTSEIIEQEIQQGTIHSLDRDNKGVVAPRKLNAPFTKSSEYLEFLKEKNLHTLLKALVFSEPVLMADQIFLKPPHVGSEKPYHQDNQYFLCTPADELITAWIALEDVDEENGCMRYIDGTHKSEVVPHVRDPHNTYDMIIPEKYLDLKKESLAIVKKGGIVFHHGNVMHKSGKNTSNRWRRGYATHWATQNVVSQSDGFNAGYHYLFSKSESQNLAITH